MRLASVAEEGGTTVMLVSVEDVMVATCAPKNTDWSKGANPVPSMVRLAGVAPCATPVMFGRRYKYCTAVGA
jgi:hypothetical protein